MSEAILEMIQVTKKYGSVTVLTEISLQVAEKQILGLLGRNGAGKTTALNLMTGYFPPTKGKIRIAGRDMMEDPRACKRRIGYLPERPPLYDELTVEEYLCFVSELREVVQKDIRRHTEEIMELCGLQEMRNRTLGRVSRGYRQRAGIAQALCGDPEILILDEPTVGLDPKQTAEMRGLIRKLGEEHTVIFSSHMLSEVQQVCQRAAILKEGRLIRVLDLNDPEQGRLCLRIRAGIGGKALREALEKLPCVEEIEIVSENNGESCARVLCREDDGERAEDRIFRRMAETGAPIREMTPEKDTLEEIFLKETE